MLNRNVVFSLICAGVWTGLLAGCPYARVRVSFVAPPVSVAVGESVVLTAHSTYTPDVIEWDATPGTVAELMPDPADSRKATLRGLTAGVVTVTIASSVSGKHATLDVQITSSSGGGEVPAVEGELPIGFWDDWGSAVALDVSAPLEITGNTALTLTGAQWFVFATGDCPSIASIDTAGSGFDTYLYLFVSDGAGGLYSLDSSDDCGDVTSCLWNTLYANTVYYLVVTGFGGDVGAYTVNVDITCDPQVAFPDAALESALRDAAEYYGGEPGSIPARIVSALTWVDGTGYGIEDLTGIEHCTALQILYLSDNSISDISHLAELTELLDLALDYNAISDIGALVDNAGLGQDDVVSLCGNPLSATAQTVDLPALEARGVYLWPCGEGEGEGEGQAEGEPGVPAAYLADQPSAQTLDVSVFAIASGNTASASGGSNWFSFTTPDCESFISIDTLGSMYDTYLYLVREDGAGGFVVVAANDDWNYEMTSAILFDGTPNTPYYAVVAGYGGATGAYTVHVSVTCSTQVAIPDPALETALRVASGDFSAPTGSLSSGMLQNFELLDASYAGISNLTGIEHCTNLHVLFLDGNALEDITPLAPLNGLTLLSLSENNIADVAPLEALTNLTELYLDTNDIVDIEALVSNAGLDAGDLLYLCSNPLSDTALTQQVPALEARSVSVTTCRK